MANKYGLTTFSPGVTYPTPGAKGTARPAGKARAARPSKPRAGGKPRKSGGGYGGS